MHTQEVTPTLFSPLPDRWNAEVLTLPEISERKKFKQGNIPDTLPPVVIDLARDAYSWARNNLHFRDIFDRNKSNHYNLALKLFQEITTLPIVQCIDIPERGYLVAVRKYEGYMKDLTQKAPPTEMTCIYVDNATRRIHTFVLPENDYKTSAALLSGVEQCFSTREWSGVGGTVANSFQWLLTEAANAAHPWLPRHTTVIPHSNAFLEKFRLSWGNYVRAYTRMWVLETHVFKDVEARRRIKTPFVFSENQLTAITDRATEQFQQKMRPLLSRLNLEIVGEATRNGVLDFHTYNFCMSAASPKSQLNRARWLKTFPRFAAREQLHPHYLDAIDNGASFIELIAQEHNVPKSTARKLIHFNPEKHTRCMTESSLQGAKSYINDLPLSFPLMIAQQLSSGAIPDLAPSADTMRGCDSLTAASFYRAIFGAMFATKMYHLGSTKKLPLLVPFIAKTGKRWSKVAEFLSAEVPKSAIEAPDFLKAAQKILLYLPLLLSKESPLSSDLIAKLSLHHYNLQDEFLLFLGERSDIVQIIEASMAWHKIFGRTNDSPTRGLFYSWSALCPELISPNGCHIIPLCDSAALIEEGKPANMSHCVAKYDSDCATTGLHIFSVRGENGARLSTLMLKEVSFTNSKENIPVGGNRAFQVIENKARENDPPPPEAEVAGTWLAKYLSDTCQTVDWKTINETRERLLSEHSSNIITGVDVKDVAARERHFNSIQHVLAPLIGKHTLESFSAVPRVQEMLRRFRAHLLEQP